MDTDFGLSRYPSLAPDVAVSARRASPAPFHPSGARRRRRTSRAILTRLASPPASGYHLARMPYEIILSPEAVDDLRRLGAFERAKVRDAMEIHLRHEPTK